MATVSPARFGVAAGDKMPLNAEKNFDRIVEGDCFLGWGKVSERFLANKTPWVIGNVGLLDVKGTSHPTPNSSSKNGVCVFCF